MEQPKYLIDTNVYDFVLISRNVTDFKNIQGLKLIDPYTL